MTPEAVENALRVLLALGGSTNAIVHLAAIAGRLGITVDLERLNELSRDDARPGGPEADRCRLHGGLPRRRRRRRRAARAGAAAPPRPADRDRRDLAASAWRGRRRPGRPGGDPAARRADLGGGRPRRALRQPGAARGDPEAGGRRRRRCSSARAAPSCSKGSRTWRARIDDPDARRDAGRLPGPQERRPGSAAAMPEAGYLPIPGKLARAGVKDMVRISDARMSGTAFGTVVLHVAPGRGRRRAAGAGRGRRPHPPQRPRATARPAGAGRRAGAGARGVAPARAAGPRLRPALRRAGRCRPPEGCDFAFLRPAR